MTKISALTALTGAGADGAADLVPVVDMSETGAARNKKMTLDELAIAVGAGGGVPNGGATGQVLTKDSGADQDTSWQDVPAAGLSALLLGTVSAIIPSPNSITPQFFGYNSASGSITAKASATTDFASTIRGFATETSSGGDAVAYTYNSAGMAFVGNAAGRGGFDFHGGFGFVEDVSTSPRFFHGLAPPATWAGNADPSSQLDIVGIGLDGGDTNLQIMHNDGAGAATKVSLGADFPWTIGTAYELTLECGPNAASISYFVQRLDDRTKTASGTLSTNLPTNTVFMGQMQWASSGAGGGGQMIVKCFGMVVADKRGAA